MQPSLWLILIVIGVFDAREYRIPNYLIVILMVFSSILLTLEQFSSSIGAPGIATHLYGFIIAFVVSLIFYTLKIMAAGDVKLIAAIGFILGHNTILIWTQYFAFTCFFVGIMYWLLNRLQTSSNCKDKREKYVGFNAIHYLFVEGKLIQSDFKQRRNLTYMPFAPVLIISLAMHQYFQY